MFCVALYRLIVYLKEVFRFFINFPSTAVNINILQIVQHLISYLRKLSTTKRFNRFSTSTNSFFQHHKFTTNPVSADAIASQLLRNGKYDAVDRKSSRLVFQEVSDLWRATTPDAVNISDNFSQREFTAALQHLKPGKAPGPDSICSELILHAGAALKSWLRDFISSCLSRLKISKIWKRALVVAILKPAKPVRDPKSYRPISLLCVPYKILERLIYVRVEPLIDPLLPKEQAGFQRGKSTVD